MGLDLFTQEELNLQPGHDGSLSGSLCICKDFLDIYIYKYKYICIHTHVCISINVIKTTVGISKKHELDANDVFRFLSFFGPKKQFFTLFFLEEIRDVVKFWALCHGYATPKAATGDNRLPTDRERSTCNGALDW